MPQRRTLACCLAGATLAAGIAACSDALAPYPQFAFAPVPVSVKQGATANVKIVLAGPNKSVRWTVSSGNTGIMTVAQTSTGATVTGVAAGTTRLYVRAPARGFPNDESRDSVTVTVTP